MPTVDPLVKQDLLLVKQSFENGALKQSGASVYVPFRTMVSSTRQVHQETQTHLTRYPSVYVKNESKQNFLDKVQQECIPCVNRLSALKDLDLSPRLYGMLDGYNATTLQSMITFFKTIKGHTLIEQNICEMYAALNEQCIPDLRRLIIAITLTIAEIRSIDIRIVANGFLQVVVSFLARFSVGLTTGLDQFTQLISSTIHCMADQIADQFAKLDPILSPAGRRDSRLLFKSAWNVKDPEKTWLTEDKETEAVYSPYFSEQVYQNLHKAALPVDLLQQGELQFQAASSAPANKENPIPINRPSLVINGLLNIVNARIDVNLDGAIQELFKLLKANQDNMNTMNDLLRQIESLMGLVALLEALINSAKGQKYDACGPDRGRRFFDELSIPGSTIYVVPPPPDAETSIDDVDIVITEDPIIVNNPIVQEILDQAGISVKTIKSASKENPDAIQFVVATEPISINFFACMKQTLG